MPQKFKTLERIDEPEGRRFATMTIGRDVMEIVRDEHQLLKGFVAKALAVDPEQMFQDDLAKFAQRVAYCDTFADLQAYADSLWKIVKESGNPLTRADARRQLVAAAVAAAARGDEPR